jgi:hypothetical protein
VKAVLSWNFVPQLRPEFTPLFGNDVVATSCIESDRELMKLIGQHWRGADGLPAMAQDCPQEIFASSLH